MALGPKRGGDASASASVLCWHECLRADERSIDEKEQKKIDKRDVLWLMERSANQGANP